jgi:hypothetical protein
MSDETWTPPPWEPPLAGTDVEHLLGALDRLRTTFRWKADGLDSAGLQQRVGASSLTVGGLLKHLAWVEEYYAAVKVGGGSPAPPWDSVDWGAVEIGWEFAAADDETPDDLYAQWDGAVTRARARYRDLIADGGLDQLVDANDGEGHHASLRRVLFDLVEEYGRHTGHTDLLREAVDGRVGDDPPPQWRPVSGDAAVVS